MRPVFHYTSTATSPTGRSITSIKLLQAVVLGVAMITSFTLKVFVPIFGDT
jgi:hypothetical protein